QRPLEGEQRKRERRAGQLHQRFLATKSAKVPPSRTGSSSRNGTLAASVLVCRRIKSGPGGAPAQSSGARRPARSAPSPACMPQATAAAQKSTTVAAVGWLPVAE